MDCAIQSIVIRRFDGFMPETYGRVRCGGYRDLDTLM